MCEQKPYPVSGCRAGAKVIRYSEWAKPKVGDSFCTEILKPDVEHEEFDFLHAMVIRFVYNKTLWSCHQRIWSRVEKLKIVPLTDKEKGEEEIDYSSANYHIFSRQNW